jgi:hypothetical protein
MSSHDHDKHNDLTPQPITHLPSPDAPDPSPPPEVTAYLSHTLPPDPGDAFFSDIAQRALALARPLNAPAPAPTPSHAYRPRLFAIAASFMLSSALLWYLLSSPSAPTVNAPPTDTTPLAATHNPPSDGTPTPLNPTDPLDPTDSIDALTPLAALEVLSASQLSVLSARLPSLHAPLPAVTDDDLDDLDDSDDLYALDGLDAQALADLQASLQTTYGLDSLHR